MRTRRKILIALAGAVCAVIVVAIVRHYQLQMEVHVYLAQLKAQGEPMDLASILPPPVPGNKNGADIIRQVAALIDTNTTLLKANYDVPAMQMVAPGKALIGWQQPDSWQELGADIAQNTNFFALLCQIESKPDFDFQIPYSHGVGALEFPKIELSESKDAALWLSDAAVYHLHAGDTAAAVDNVRAILALCQGMRDERFVISELVRIAIAQLAVCPTWEILQSPSVTDAQLAQLQNNWAALEFVKCGEYALAMERATGLITLDEWRASSSKFASDLNLGQEAGAKYDLGGDEEESFLSWVTTRPRIYLWRDWWSYRDELRSLKGDEILLASMRLAQTNGSFASALDYQDAQLKKLRLPEDNDGLFSGNPDFHSLLSESVSVLRGFPRDVMIVETARQTVITAISLKRYQLKHGTFPPNLNAMVPEFLPAVPLDPVDGKPLRYHPNGDGDGTYLLYSVGLNATDDDGNPAMEKSAESEGAGLFWLNKHRLDWVWPQPATKAEIQNYRAHPPK